MCGKCMHTMHFFYRLGKPYINLVSLYPLITLLANQTVCNTWSRTRSLTCPHNGEYNYNQNSLTVLQPNCTLCILCQLTSFCVTNPSWETVDDVLHLVTSYLMFCTVWSCKVILWYNPGTTCTQSRVKLIFLKY